MKIKIEGELPFKFETVYGPMQVASSRCEFKESRFVLFFFAAMATATADRKLRPVRVSPLAPSVEQIETELRTGITIERDQYPEESYEFRVLDALAKAPGVILVSP